MTEEIKDGGQAFPQPIAVSPMGDCYPAYPGMTLRDYFAAKAVSAVIGAIMKDEGHNWTSKDFAREAYEIADSMLAAREVA